MLDIAAPKITNPSSPPVRLPCDSSSPASSSQRRRLRKTPRLLRQPPTRAPPSLRVRSLPNSSCEGIYLLRHTKRRQLQSGVMALVEREISNR
nr:hypothetical protein Iba_chr15fCG6960 [Ipomoea batatas]